MSDDETAYKRRMGPQLAQVHDALWQELAWLWSKWEVFDDLFVARASRIEILNAAAGSFFYVVQRTLWESVLLGVARLTDQPKNKHQLNLTVLALPNMVAPTARAAVEGAVERAKIAASFAREWRHKRIAHADLHHTLDQEAHPVPAATAADALQAIRALADVVDELALAYDGPRTAWHVLKMHDGAMNLLYTLRDGVAAHKARIERLYAGEINASEFSRDDL